MNKVFLFGTVIGDPRVFDWNGKTGARFMVETREHYRDQTYSEKHKLVWFNASDPPVQGETVCVEGKLQTRKNKQNDQWETSIVVQQVQQVKRIAAGAGQATDDPYVSDDMPF